jgi:ankyrin repeat protein
MLSFSTFFPLHHYHNHNHNHPENSVSLTIRTMPQSNFPLRWETTGQQWWYASPIDLAAANGHYDLVIELLHLDTNLLIKLTSLQRIRRLETLWNHNQSQFSTVAKCRSTVAKNLMLECETEKNGRKINSLIKAGYGGWLLYTAASAGDVDFVCDLLRRESSLVFGEGEYGVTDILYAAARSQNCEVFKILFDSAILSHQLDLDEVFKMDMVNRGVHAAARGGSWEILKHFVKSDSHILAYTDSYGCTVLHTAAATGQVQVCP